MYLPMVAGVALSATRVHAVDYRLAPIRRFRVPRRLPDGYRWLLRDGAVDPAKLAVFGD